MISDWCISLLFVTGKQDRRDTLLLQELFIFLFFFILFDFLETYNLCVYQNIHCYLLSVLFYVFFETLPKYTLS